MQVHCPNYGHQGQPRKTGLAVFSSTLASLVLTLWAFLFPLLWLAVLAIVVFGFKTKSACADCGWPYVGRIVSAI